MINANEFRVVIKHKSLDQMEAFLEKYEPWLIEDIITKGSCCFTLVESAAHKDWRYLPWMYTTFYSNPVKLLREVMEGMHGYIVKREIFLDDTVKNYYSSELVKKLRELHEDIDFNYFVIGYEFGLPNLKVKDEDNV